MIRFVLQQNDKWVDFLKDLIIKNLLETSRIFSKCFSVLDAIHQIFDMTILILKGVRLPGLLIFQDFFLC